MKRGRRESVWKQDIEDIDGKEKVKKILDVCGMLEACKGRRG